MKLNKPAGIIAALLLSFFATDSTFAITTSNDISQETETATTTDEKIQGIRDEVKRAVEEKLQDVINQDIKKGWVGTVKSKDITSLIIEDKQGNQKEVLYDDETVIFSEDRKTLEADDLVVGKSILAMGYLQSIKILEGKRIMFIKEEEKVEARSVIGLISDKSVEANLIAVTPSKDKDEVVEMEIDTKSDIILEDDSQGSYDDLSIGQKVVIVFEQVGTKKTAKAIRIIS